MLNVAGYVLFCAIFTMIRTRFSPGAPFLYSTSSFKRVEQRKFCNQPPVTILLSSWKAGLFTLNISTKVLYLDHSTAVTQKWGSYPRILWACVICYSPKHDWGGREKLVVLVMSGVHASEVACTMWCLWKEWSAYCILCYVEEHLGYTPESLDWIFVHM